MSSPDLPAVCVFGSGNFLAPNILAMLGVVFVAVALFSSFYLFLPRST